VPHNLGFPVLLPFLPPKERLIGDAAGVIFDCTWPKDWPQQIIPVKANSKISGRITYRRKLSKNWRLSLMK
jgi:hypothetical protein